jgi:hypothetical protein
MWGPQRGVAANRVFLRRNSSIFGTAFYSRTSLGLDLVRIGPI